MSLWRVLLRNAPILLVAVGLLQFVQSDYLKMYSTTTSTVLPPHLRSPGLSLPVRHSRPEKCHREVPAIYFQYEKDVPIIGNSTDNKAFNLVEVCCPGYKRYDFDWSMCVPDCGNKCQRNGFCIEGGICQCFDDFVLDHRSECVPTCPLGCPNGQCYLNGTCVCDRGYALDATKKFCIPICSMGCGHNEICVEPDKCICAEGYAHSPIMGCQPICVPNCGHGYCVAPNQCDCFVGYYKRNNSAVCESSCYMHCENGFCANMTTCVCQNGYKYDKNTTSCLPDCGDDCENGICMAPGKCRCFNGYYRNGPRCDAICPRGCGYYGKCIRPDVCGCAVVDGPYKSYQQCEFGYCTSKGRCRCQEGRTRFIDMCLPPDQVTTYAATYPVRLNVSLNQEFDLLIGRHFKFGIDLSQLF